VNDNDKRFHGWGQSESGMEDLIGRVSMPGQVILDPFCGGGTTGVAAVSMNRFFVGADVDAKAIETTARRLKEVCDAAILE
jgi:DNA modification methylase